MKLDAVIKSDKVDFSNIPPEYFLIGLLSAFENRFQTIADNTMKEISWKQFFAIICISFCKEPPTINDLAEILGSSHQNVKQILLKLEKKGFIKFEEDKQDKRKQRIVVTKVCLKFCDKNNETSSQIMQKMFEGIPEKYIKTTIKTIIRMDNNLK